MLNDRDDPTLDVCPILDVCLEETLGGERPPDLSARILAAWHNSQQSGPQPHAAANGQHANGVAAAPTIAFRPIPINAPRQTVGAETVNAPAVVARLPAETSAWQLARLPMAVAAGLLVAVGSVWFFGRQASEPNAGPLAAAGQTANKQASAEQPAAGKNAAEELAHQHALTTKATFKERENEASKSETTRAVNRPEAAVADNAVAGNKDNKPAPADAVAQTAKRTSDRPVADRPVADRQGADAPRSPGRDRATDLSVDANSVASTSELTAVSASATSDKEITDDINRMLRARWQEAGVRPSPAATDAEWCRRVFLDLIGRIPTIAELEAYLVDNARDKRARLVDELLSGDGYAQAYAHHWTAIWTTTLVGRNGGMEPNSPVNREGLQQYLRRSFLHNKPYDRLVYELISAEGSNRPGEDDFNGAVNFVIDNLQENAATATAKTAQLFLGLQIQCTQCHNHPFNEWQQNRFWELNAFFRQARAVREMQGGQLKLVRLVDEDFAGEGASPDLDEAEIYYEQRNGLMQAAYPVFIDGTELDRSGFVSDVDRREELARLVVRSDEFGLALVNRMWAHCFGHGFTKPYDDLGPHNPPSHPELLARLGREFAAHGHDLKRLLRWIALSEAYSLSSKYGSKFGNAADDPATGSTPLFSHFYLRQMTAEQLYDSLLAATEAQATLGDYEQQQRIKDEWLKQFAITFGTDENNEATTFDGTIAQALMMMNGELTRQATRIESDSFLGRMARQGSNSNPIPRLYLAALGRRPSRAELQLANGLLASRDGNAATVLEDVWWALLNSNEFILNH
jgi:hypothetical protein